MNSIPEMPDALRPTGRRRKTVKVATLREIQRFGGYEKALAAGYELPRIAGGALTQVPGGSGTFTPTVGTTEVSVSQSPSTASLFVLELDTTAMQKDDHIFVNIRKGTAAVPAAAAQGVAGGGMYGGNAAAPAGAITVVGASTTVTAASDSQGNAYSVAGDLAWSTRPLVAVPNLTPDWINPLGLEPGDGISVTTAAVNVVAAAISGVAINAVPYATATGATTSANVTANDPVVASLPSGAAVPAGWTAAAVDAGAALVWRLAPGGATVTCTGAAGIVAFPAAASQVPAVGRAAFRHGQFTPWKESIPFLCKSTETMTFGVIQNLGTARSFPYQLYTL